MYLKRVVLQNIKGFGSAELDFCPDGENYPGWAVITGDNGSGKTALLRAIAMAILGPDQVRSLVPDLTGWVSEGSSSGTISVEVRPENTFDKTAKGGYPIEGTFWSEIKIQRVDGSGTKVDGSGTFEVQPADVFRKKKKSATNGPWHPTTGGWATLAYGPFRRLYGSSPDASRLMVIPGRVPRFATLFKEDATLGECEEWAKDLQYKRLENDLQAALTLDSLFELVGEDFLSRGVRVDKVDSNGLWLLDQQERRIPLSDMSEGYRSALAMLVDIFRHLVEIYGPDIVEKDEDGQASVTRPAVVMIDEIDTHLHPGWQRNVGFWLQKHFPRVQFLVTTHSPLICQAADNGRIYHLPNSEDDDRSADPFQLTPEDVDRVISGRPDQILVSPAFGLNHTRSPVAVEAREEHARLKSKKHARGSLDDRDVERLTQLELFVRD